MDVRPIRTDEDHRAAVAEIERLWGAPVGSPDGDKLDVLATLVDAYENKRWPVEGSDPVEILHHALREMGHTQSELGRILGSRSRASEVLGRRRRLTVEMIHAITEAWKIPAELLARPYDLVRSKPAPRRAGTTPGATRRSRHRAA
ncbi:MAG TPA: transcriptional regulator [Beijerinckiaceae bacterium]|nr:transcriptional regulator [Beijerinckiaceae bacterium]